MLRRHIKPKNVKMQKAPQLTDAEFFVRLLTNIPFLLLCLCNLFSTQGLYIPYVYLVELAMSEGN